MWLVIRVTTPQTDTLSTSITVEKQDFGFKFVFRDENSLCNYVKEQKKIISTIVTSVV